MMNRSLWYNASGYLDTTAGAALSRILRDERKHRGTRVHPRRPCRPATFELSLYDSEGNCLSVERFPTAREAERQCVSMEKSMGLNGKIIPIR